MKYTPFIQVGDFFFTESFVEIKEKSIRYKNVDISEKFELDRKYPCIYIYDIDLFIVFNQNGKGIRYIETKNDIYLNRLNLHKEPLEKIKNNFLDQDKSISINEEGALESKKFGFIVSKACSRGGNHILLYGKDYLIEKEISPDDIINFYLND